MHGHRADTQLTTGTLDAQGDFAPVGDEDFLKHINPLVQ
jgi:hypothetical protein